MSRTFAWVESHTGTRKSHVILLNDSAPGTMNLCYSHPTRERLAEAAALWVQGASEGQLDAFVNSPVRPTPPQQPTGGAVA